MSRLISPILAIPGPSRADFSMKAFISSEHSNSTEFKGF
jgi:hypothetical protein